MFIQMYYERYMRFPGGMEKAITFSYDDGVRQDRRLVEILNRYGLTATFNISFGLFGVEERGVSSDPNVDVSKLEQQEALALYAGHEIAGHCLRHANLTGLGAPAAMYEILEDKKQLEQLAGRPLRSFAYPYGAFDPQVQQLLELAGYQSARTTRSTYGFDLPQNLLVWDPTCHHRDPRLMELADSITEIKTICDCGAKATVNARVTPDGRIVTEGEQVFLGGNDSYVAMCHKCYIRGIREHKVIRLHGQH